MAKIQKLDSHVADLIAAGEVVERPGSVVKELIENSIDAGARSVSVEIKGGGMTYIRVTDNGCGIAWDDAETAFLRHATSKLRDERGLEAIGTLGFRGEALAAIAAVSKIELLTRETGADSGTRLTIDGGVIMDKSPAGCPEGTTITVRDIFFNTPARLKFMKNDRAEGANVSAVVLRCAMSRPEVSVKYVKDGKEEFQTPGDGRRDSCIYSLLGRDFASSMLKVETDDGEVAVKGYVSSPANARGNRSYQFFFVNGRNIKSRTLQSALEQAYKNSLFTGRFPACVLYIEISPASVDVNVHPTKTEVKFLNEKQVSSGVYYSALAALAGETEKAQIELKDDVKSGIIEKTQLSGNKNTAVGMGIKSAGGKSVPVDSGAVKRTTPKSGAFFKEMTAETFRKTYSPDAFKTAVPAPAEKTGLQPVHDETRVPYQTRIDIPEKTETVRKESIAAVSNAETAGYRIIGEGLNTYIIVEKGDSLFLVDKHAAHERMIFDRLKEENADVMPQMLIAPAVFDMMPEDIVILEENSKLLQRLGIDVSRFGDKSVAVRQVPSGIGEADIGPMLGEICEDIRLGGVADKNAGADRVLKTVACKAAIKAGKPSDLKELTEIVAAVMEGSVKYCPHGRPVAMELSKNTLDKNFKRI